MQSYLVIHAFCLDNTRCYSVTPVVSPLHPCFGAIYFLFSVSFGIVNVRNNPYYHYYRFPIWFLTCISTSILPLCFAHHRLSSVSSVSDRLSFANDRLSSAYRGL